MKITSEQIDFIQKAKNTLNKGYYPDGHKAVDMYMQVFEEEIKQGKMRKNLSPRCGSCIKEAVNALYNLTITLEEKLKNEERVSKEDKGIGAVSQ